MVRAGLRAPPPLFPRSPFLSSQSLLRSLSSAPPPHLHHHHHPPSLPHSLLFGVCPGAVIIDCVSHLQSSPHLVLSAFLLPHTRQLAERSVPLAVQRANTKSIHSAFVHHDRIDARRSASCRCFTPRLRCPGRLDCCFLLPFNPVVFSASTSTLQIDTFAPLWSSASRESPIDNCFHEHGHQFIQYILLRHEPRARSPFVICFWTKTTLRRIISFTSLSLLH